jgi:hypothetical protein
MEDAAAIGAGISGLQTDVPGEKLPLAAPILFLASRFIPLVVSRRVVPPARLAPPLVVVVPAVEIRDRFAFAAPLALPHLGRLHERMFASCPDTTPRALAKSKVVVLLSFREHKIRYAPTYSL